MFCSLFGGQIYTENVCSPVTSVRSQILILRKPLCPVRTNNQHGMFELEELGQYNQRNSIVFHGLKENSAGVDNTTEAKIKYVKDQSLGMQLDVGCIDRSHRMGHSSSESAGTRNPRPVTVVKFTSYEPCRAIFTAKRKLKGTNIVITENFTRRQVDLLRKARASSNVNQPGVVRTITSSRQQVPNSHLTAWFSPVWTCPPNIKHAVDSKYQTVT